MPALATPVAVDPRTAAYCTPGGPEVFSGIVHGNQIWAADPFDVESIHPDAREAFARLLGRASAVDLPPTGKTLLLLGEAGSGKTHLMRAFRTTAHANGSGYCGYLQMTSRTDNYARYVLGYLIDSLDHPYRPDGTQTGLRRLAGGLLDALDMAAEQDKARLTDDTVIDSDDLGRLVHRLAHLAVQDSRFKNIHVDVLRAVLYLLSPDQRVHALAVRWLRCEDLDKFDRELLGDLVPRPDAEMAIKTIWDLGRLMHAVHTAALVLLVDQIEEVVELDQHGPQPGETFRQAVNTLVEVADGLPNAVVVIGCLEDLFKKGREKLPKPKLDRLEVDPDPIRLTGTRTEPEVNDIVGRRLEVLFDALSVPTDADNPVAPYTAAGLQPLAKLRSRDILDNLRRHRGVCQAKGEWVPPKWGAGQVVKPVDVTWEQKWNDFSAAFKMPFFDEDRQAELLAFAIATASAEMPDGMFFGANVSAHLISVDVHLGGEAVDPLYVAVCEKSTRGGGLGNQIERVAKKAGEIPTVVVRSTEFPTDLKQKAGMELAKLVKPKGRGRKVVVSNSDWRAMAAFREFHGKHKAEPGFAAWQKAERPLAELPAVSAILDLNALLAQRPVSNERPLPPPLVPPPPPLLPAVPKATTDAPIPLGQTRGAVPAPVELKPKDLCRHAAFLGGSGSGKTTAALAVIEELLLAGVPAVLLDRKGDLARYADPAAWTTSEPDAERAKRRSQLRSVLDITLYTPGTDSGRPLTIPVVPDDLAQMSSADREQTAQFAAASLGLMMGYKSKAPDPKRVILQKAIEVLARTPGRPVTVKALRELVGEMDDALTLELSGYDDKHFKKLSQDLLTLAHQHRRLLEGGELLNVDDLLGRRLPPGKTRLAVVNTQFLGDPGTVDFWVSQFLLAVDRWRAKNPADSLQAVFMFDEADQYLPAQRQPATKGPMESLLKRARSAGLGLFLATQSPGDLDYRCRDQVLTWLVGRVKEPVAIAKLKPMLDRRPDAADKLAHQKAGEFYLVRESDVTPVHTARNLISTEQVPEDRILTLARGG